MGDTHQQARARHSAVGGVEREARERRGVRGDGSSETSHACEVTTPLIPRAGTCSKQMSGASAGRDASVAQDPAA